RTEPRRRPPHSEAPPPPDRPSGRLYATRRWKDVAMQRHQFSFEIEATPEEVWGVLHPPPPKHPPAGERRVIEYNDVRIEIVNEGDDNGEGLVRTCTFRV